MAVTASEFLQWAIAFGIYPASGGGGLTPIAANSFLANTTGSSAVPVATTITPANLGLGTISTQNANSVAITGGDAVFSALQAPFTYAAVTGDIDLNPDDTLTAFEFKTTSGTSITDALGLASYTNGFIMAITNTTSGDCTFVPFSGEFINGASSLTIGSQAGFLIQKNPDQWSIIASNLADTLVYPISPANGGTGVNNGASTITIGGDASFVGAYTFTGTLTGNTAVTFPTSGTLATTSALPTPAALTESNDTNVTLTLGGTPSTALLQAVSITAGWTGTLSVPRGGTGVASTGAYGLIAGGTTTTAALQNAGTGTSGQIYVSGGSSALGSWTNLVVSPFSIGSGTNSVQGVGATAAGNYSFAQCSGASVGSGAANSIAFGLNATVNASASNSFALGDGSIVMTGATFAYALGRGSTVTNTGSVVWSDNTNSGLTDASENEFMLNFTNGYKFNLGAITTGIWNGTKIGITYGGTGVTSVTTAPAATAFAGWDANSNLSANNFLSGYATTATAAASTTLLVGSAYQQYFTGTTTQSVLLPVTSTLVLGQSYYIVNNSTGVVTVESSGGNTIKAMAAGSNLLVTVISTSGTTAASWNYEYGLQAPGGSGITNDGINAAGQFIISDSTTGAIGTTDNSYNSTSYNLILGGVSTPGSNTGLITIGQGITVTGTSIQSIAIGQGSKVVNGYQNIAIGRQANAVGGAAIAIGNTASASSTSGDGIAIGDDALSPGQYGIAIGSSANSGAIAGVAIGYSANSTSYSIAIGDSASSSGAKSTAIGYYAKAIYTGDFTICDSQKSLIYGSAQDQYVASFTGGFFDYVGTTLATQIDTNANLNISQNLNLSYATTATVATTTTLTVASKYQQYFTGTTTQIVLLPVTSTLVLGMSYYIVNNSTGVVTVESSGGNTIYAMAAGSRMLVTCILITGTTASSWNYEYALQGPATIYNINVPNVSAISLSNGAVTNVTSQLLTQGTWRVSAGVFINFSGIATAAASGVSIVSANLPDNSLTSQDGLTSGVLQFWGGPCTTQILTVSSGGETVYLVAYSAFSTGAATACGNLICEKIA